MYISLKVYVCMILCVCEYYIYMYIMSCACVLVKNAFLQWNVLYYYHFFFLFENLLYSFHMCFLLFLLKIRVRKSHVRGRTSLPSVMFINYMARAHRRPLFQTNLFAFIYHLFLYRYIIFIQKSLEHNTCTVYYIIYIYLSSIIIL